MTIKVQKPAKSRGLGALLSIFIQFMPNLMLHNFYYTTDCAYKGTFLRLLALCLALEVNSSTTTNINTIKTPNHTYTQQDQYDQVPPDNG